MNHTTDSHYLHYLNHHLARYESEEEDISESDVYSPVTSQRTAETLDSDLSADESNYEWDGIPRLRSYSPNRRSRPVSMDTVKRSSGATFVGHSFLLDQDDPIELSTDAASTQSIPLRPAVHVSPEARLKRLSCSTSGASAFSDEEPADLLVAEEVTYMEPHAKPNVVMISSFADPESEVSKRRLRDRKRAYRNSSINSMGEIEIPWLESTDDPGSLRDISQDRGPSYQHARPVLHPISTTIPQHSNDLNKPQLRERPISFSRPFSGNSSPAHRRLTTDISHRPPSTRSTSSASLYTSPSPYPNDDSHDRHGSSLNLHIANSNPPSPVPYYSSPTFYRERTGSSYSASMLGARSPVFPRSPIKHSITSSNATTNSTMSNMSVLSLSERAMGTQDEKSPKKAGRRKSLRRVRQNSGEAVDASHSPSGSVISPSSPLKGFGLIGIGKLGRKKTTLMK